MRYPGGPELSDGLKRSMARARRLEWISIGYWISAIVLMYFALGQSQAMKAAWIEDILSLFPPIAFLIAASFRERAPDGRFAWGYHRAITLAYLVATVALTVLGLFILFDSVDKLIKGDHPTIGMVELFDTQVWLGWLMIGALLYGVVPSLILGRLKKPLADELHDKVLFADAKMNQADWLTALAAIVGILGIGLGIWFADSLAAIVIAVDVLHDGQKYLRGSIADLMDARPTTHDESGPHPLTDRVGELVAAESWIDRAALRMREEGQVLTGEVLVVPSDLDASGLVGRCEALSERLRALDWRIHDVSVAPVRSLDGAPEDLIIGGEGT